MPTLQRILHVEDEPSIREVVAMVLEAIGNFTVETCDSGRDAIAKATAFSPDLILLDVMMPEMDGPATLKELRKNPKTAGIPVIFMTAKVQSHEIDHFLTLGAAAVIEKPFDPETICDQIQQIWQVATAARLDLTPP